MSEAIKRAIKAFEDVLEDIYSFLPPRLAWEVEEAKKGLEAILPQLERAAVYGVPARRTSPGVDVPWIKWEGGPQPVGDEVKVEVCYRGCPDFDPHWYMDSGHEAKWYEWRHNAALAEDGDIVAYRVIPEGTVIPG